MNLKSNAGGTTPEGHEPPVADVGSLLREAFAQERTSKPSPNGATAEPVPTESDENPDELPEPPAEWESETDPAATAKKPEEPKPAPPPSPAQPAPEVVTRWANAIRRQPQRISEVPAPHRPAVIADALRQSIADTADELSAAAQAALEDVRRTAYNAGMAAARDSAVAATEMDELKLIRQADPTEWARLSQEDPRKVARFLAAEAREAAPETKVVDAAQATFARLQRYPGAVEALQEWERQHPGRYAPTQTGLANLQNDADAAIEAAISARNQPKAPESAPDPAAEAEARRRQEAAEARKKLPVPDTQSSASGRPEPTLPNDRNELLRMAMREARQPAR